MPTRPTTAIVYLYVLASGAGAAAAQDLSRVGDRAQSVAATDAWEALVYARAMVAVESDDGALLDAALDEIERLPSGSVDAPLQVRPLPEAPTGGAAATEEFVLNVVLPYLYPEAAGRDITCGPIQTMELTTFDQRGEAATALREARVGCSAGDVPFSYRGTRVVEGGTTTVDVEAFDLEGVVSIGLLASGRTVVTPLTESGTLLAMAAGLGRVTVVERLLAAGADPDARSTAGRTALMDAATSDYIGTVRALLDGGASVDLPTPDGRTPLLIASEAGQLDAVDALLSGGADPAATDGDGRTAVHMVVDSAGSGSVPVLERLLAAGAEIEASTRSGSERPLHVALRNGRADAARALLRLGADASASDGRGRTTVGLATDAGLDLLDALVAGGADVDEIDGEGLAALHRAAAAPSGSMVDQLLALSADVDIRGPEGATPLMLAAEVGSTASVTRLLSGGADIGATDVGGNTALHRAAAAGEDRTAEQLLRAGAARGVKNSDGRSAQDLAGRNGHGNVQSLFRQTKRVHLALLSGAVGFAKLGDPQHESSVAWEYALGLGVKVTDRARLHASVAWATRTTDPTEDGPVFFTGDGDFYYAAYSIDVRPTLRYALGNPYRTHVYIVGGASFSTIEEVEILDWTGRSGDDGTTVTDLSDTSMTSVLGGLGVQGMLGRVITSVELVARRGSEIRLERFRGSFGSVNLGLSFAW